MRKLIESTLVSLDGVVESPDRWAPFDQEAVAYSMNELEHYDAFVMGRVTYERLRAIWEPVTGNPYIEAINHRPKHVATRSLDQLGWNATPLGDDVTGDERAAFSAAGGVPDGAGRDAEAHDRAAPAASLDDADPGPRPGERR